MYMSVPLSNLPIVAKTTQITTAIYKLFDLLSPISDLLIRLWVANVFFKSGLTKIQSFDTTLELFRNEYHTPLLPPDLAAYLATAGELGFSVLLAIGLAGRFSALGLFFVNIVAALSYYPEIGPEGLRDHVLWGILLLAALSHGPGKLSIDYLIGKFINR